MLRTERGPMFWLVPLTVIILATVVIGIVIANQGGSDADAQEESSSSQNGSAEEDVDLSFVEHRDPDEANAVGDVDAPVTLVMYSDYQCPYCATWNEDTLPAMMDYVDSGDLRIEWREVNVFGSASEQAAKAAYAAALQDKHWEFHNALFAGGEPRSPDELTPEALTAVAEQIGLDTEQFTADMNSEETAAAVADNAAMGTDLGAFSTPTFILDGQPYVGAQPTDVFVYAVEAAKKGQN